MARDVQKMISPVCTAAYAWLAKPDEGQEFSDGKFKVPLLLDKDDKEATAFVKQLEDLSDEVAETKWSSKPKKLNYAYKDGDDKDKEDFANKWLLVAKTKFRPGMVDCGEPPMSLLEGAEPQSGDLIRASFALIPYEVAGRKGVSAQLRNVQLVEKRNNGSNQNDFDGLDGGYKVSNVVDVIEDDEDF